jgi:hypothetical protein
MIKTKPPRRIAIAVAVVVGGLSCAYFYWQYAERHAQKESSESDPISLAERESLRHRLDEVDQSIVNDDAWIARYVSTKPLQELSDEPCRNEFTEDVNAPVIVTGEQRKTMRNLGLRDQSAGYDKPWRATQRARGLLAQPVVGRKTVDQIKAMLTRVFRSVVIVYVSDAASLAPADEKSETASRARLARGLDAEPVGHVFWFTEPEAGKRKLICHGPVLRSYKGLSVATLVKAMPLFLKHRGDP